MIPKFLRRIAVFLIGSAAALAQKPVVLSVLNAADYSTSLAPGCWVAIFGTNLAASPATVTALPLPLQLGNATVTVDGTAIPLRYVSPGQVNALMPFTTAVGFHRLLVTTSAGTNDPFQILLNTVAPSIYTINSAGTGPALVFDVGFNAVSKIGTDPLILYAGGLGPTNPAGTVDGGNSSEPLNRVVNPVTVRIGGQIAQVSFAGLAPGLPGVYQLNVSPPSGPLADNTVTLTNLFPGTTVQSVQSGVTTLPVPAGQNTMNVAGKITPLYPVSSTVLTQSALLTAANFSTAFDILPGAKSFSGCGLREWNQFADVEPGDGRMAGFPDCSDRP
jgi:uncharacterized protein (TIGR03437 family)